MRIGTGTLFHRDAARRSARHRRRTRAPQGLRHRRRRGSAGRGAPGGLHGKQIADLPPALLERYFERDGDRHTFHRDLRRCVIFGRHDLIQDAPISRVDLLLCRNTLMYFNADAQARIMARFYFSLRPGGVLLLGRAEMLFSYVGMFQPVDLKRRIFKDRAEGERSRATAARAHPAPEETMTEPSRPRPAPRRRVRDVSRRRDHRRRGRPPGRRERRGEAAIQNRQRRRSAHPSRTWSCRIARRSCVSASTTRAKGAVM